MLPETQHWGLLALDPDVLEGMTEEQWRELCGQLRNEQVRRWKLVNGNTNGYDNGRSSTDPSKRVTFLLDDLGNPKTFVLGEAKPALPINKPVLVVSEVPATKTFKDVNFHSRYSSPGDNNENTNRRPTDAEKYDNVGKRASSPQPQSPKPTGYDIYSVAHVGTRDTSGSPTLEDLDEDDLRLHNLLVESREHIFDLEQQREREREEWLNRKKYQLKERQKWHYGSSGYGSGSSSSSSPVSTPPSSPVSRLDEAPYQRAALQLSQQAHNDLQNDYRDYSPRSYDAETISEIARHARNEHRRISGLDRSRSLSETRNRWGRTSPILYSIRRIYGGVPTSRASVIQWFQREELPKGAGLEPGTNNVATWFHGIISRSEAERLLASLPVGSFLVRVSEKIWGYAVSYKTYGGFRHFLIQVINGKYQLIGAGYMKHDSLAELINHHRIFAVSNSGQEYLIHPCPQATAIPDYLELFGNVILGELFIEDTEDKKEEDGQSPKK